MAIPPALLRLTWATIETLSTTELLTLSETALIKLIMQRVTRQLLLSGEDICALYDYIATKTTLIRDLAMSSREHEEMLRLPEAIAS